MNKYRYLGNQMATTEARDLAEQLVAWHDAMVRHLRVLGARDDARCADDCPHDDAESLWTLAQATFGASASDLEFLREHGEPRRASTFVRARDRAAEMGA